MSKLLLDEQPLVVLPSLAIKLGLNESLVLQQLHYWLQKSNQKRDGFYWVYNTYKEWNQQFPFWSLNTIRRAIANLEKNGVIVSGNYNDLKIDKTKWYRIDYERVIGMSSPCAQNGQSSCPDWTDELPKLDKPLPEITTDISSSSKKAHARESGGMPTPGLQDDPANKTGEIPHTQLIARELERLYLQLKGQLTPTARDLQDIYEVAKTLSNSDVPLDDILRWTRECFEHYKPQYPGQKITSFAYCKPRILENYYLHMERENQKEGSQNAKHQPVTRKPSQTKSGPSEETKRLESLAREQGIFNGEISDTDVDF
jgi:hypothetical protein